MSHEARPESYGRVNGKLICLLGALALVASFLALPAEAAASPARYTFEMCDSALPGGGVTGVRYSQNPGEPWSPTDNCEVPGGFLAIHLIGSSASGGSADWALPIEPPPGGTMESTAIFAASCVSWPTSAYILNPGWPPGGCSEEDRVFHLPQNFRGFDINLACFENCSAGAWIYAHYFATIEVDPVPPTLKGLEGSLLAGGVIRGRGTLSTEADDEGGGVSNVSVNVNGLPAAQPKVSNCDVAQTNNPSVQGTVAAAIIPCPTAVSANWTLNTEAYPFHNGSNSVQVCTSDFATLGEPNTTCSAPKTVNVDDSCGESPVSGGEVLSAQFSESNAETVTVGYGKGAEVTGQLADDAGDPVAGATLCVKMQTQGVEPNASAVGSVKTDANGQYSYKVAPGPDRNVIIGYRHDASQVAREVRYYSHAEPTLQLAPRRVRNGHDIRLWGSLPGPAPGGRVVVLQASALHARRWLTFAHATANGHGAFQSHYRFTSTTATTTYRIRAVVPTQANYPWVEGASRPVRVRVRS